jgi:hypothetical protein
MVSVTGVILFGVKTKFVCCSGVWGGVRLLSSETVKQGSPPQSESQDPGPWRPIGPVPGKSCCLCGARPLSKSYLLYLAAGWYDWYTVVSGAGLLAGLLRKSKSGAGNCGVKQKKSKGLRGLSWPLRYHGSLHINRCLIDGQAML